MDARQLRETYQQFFEKQGHARIPSAPLVPENDPSVLFTTAGMQPLVPYLLGEPHPQGRRLTNVQRCIRTNDIEEVGDTSHLTFFEMLGNWSLGDYFKRESLGWSHEFLTTVLRIDPGRLAVTVFAGDEDAPRDDEAAGIWRSLGIPDEKIYYLPKEDNWWGPVGTTGPCGPDSEIFFDTGRPDHPGCRPGCPCGKWFEIWNNVFMEYHKTPAGQYRKLDRPNVDTGMGVDRTIAALNGYDDVFRIETIWPVVERLQELSGKAYAENPHSFRVIADHIRSAAMAMADGARPSNVEAGYVVRRLIRRAMIHGRELGIEGNFCSGLAGDVLDIFCEVYPVIDSQRGVVLEEMELEETRFQNTLRRGLKQYRKVVDRLARAGETEIQADEAFDLFQNHGFPLALTKEMAEADGLSVDEAGFEALYTGHKQMSRQASDQKFKGGLADQTGATRRLHTATHLLHAALRTVLGPEVQQMGSNITAERLRFDFSCPQKLTPEQLMQVEQIVNDQIERALPVFFEVMALEQARAAGALAFFGEKYGEQVKVYSIGSFSKEICGGPHAGNTAELGSLKIQKEEAVGRGVRRIRAIIRLDEAG